MKVPHVSTRPQHAKTYEVAGRLLLVDASSTAIFEATDRFLSAWQVLRVDSVWKVSSPAAVLKVSKGRCERTDELTLCATTEEADYFQGENSYVVRVGDSLISADHSSVVNVLLGKGSDDSIRFRRVISHAFSTAMRRTGAFELHSAALVDPKTKVAALIVGPSGSGKSTLALHLASSGWSFSTDDVVLLTKGDEGIEAHGLRTFFALTIETILNSGLSKLDPLIENHRPTALSKIPLQPQQIFSAKFIEKCVPNLLIFPRKTGDAHSRVQQLTQAETMKRLLKICPWALMDRPKAWDFQSVVARLTKQCAAFDLFAARDLLKDPEYTSTVFASLLRNRAA